MSACSNDKSNDQSSKAGAPTLAGDAAEDASGEAARSNDAGNVRGTSIEDGVEGKANADRNRRSESDADELAPGEQPGSYMASTRMDIVTEAQARDWWDYGELLKVSPLPAGFRQLLLAGCSNGGRNECDQRLDKIFVRTWYLPNGADENRDNIFELIGKGSFVINRFFTPAGFPAAFDEDPDYPGRYKKYIVRGQEARMQQAYTDSPRPQEPWQTGSNYDHRIIYLQTNIPTGAVQWSTKIDWRKQSVEWQLQMMEDLVSF